jgi:hypothetical protein
MALECFHEPCHNVLSGYRLTALPPYRLTK